MTMKNRIPSGSRPLPGILCGTDAAPDNYTTHINDRGKTYLNRDCPRCTDCPPRTILMADAPPRPEHENVNRPGHPDNRRLRPVPVLFEITAARNRSGAAAAMTGNGVPAGSGTYANPVDLNGGLL